MQRSFWRLFRVRSLWILTTLSNPVLTFSRLIAYGVFQMDSKLWGWQILFLIEGAFTAAFALLVAVLLPWSVSSASFLTEREKEVGRLRILKDGSEKTETKLQMKAFFKPLKDWRFYVFGAIGKSSISLYVDLIHIFRHLITPLVT